MKTYILAVFVACFVYSYGLESICRLEDPVERKIDGGNRSQTTYIMKKIDVALSNNTEVNISVNEISATRLATIPNLFVAIDTCPRRLVFITYLVLNRETCYVVHPRQQRVTYAICGGSDCYRNIVYKSRCFTT
ncbi:uncharacterized protein LOC134236894 [Saccostrea cucullata]|uniref:uncharacterized protein LOC134236894 n=1 Tax=Saccostrea cuccullata TaxID=36930 RepID=UPI002ECFEED1